MTIHVIKERGTKGVPRMLPGDEFYGSGLHVSALNDYLRDVSAPVTFNSGMSRLGHNSCLVVSVFDGIWLCDVGEEAGSKYVTYIAYSRSIGPFVIVATKYDREEDGDARDVVEVASKK